jgi:tetratricopeptide (TPR) repeat protein
MRYCRTLSAVFAFFVFSLTASAVRAEEVDLTKTKRLSLENYLYQNALYLYYLKYYLASSDIANAALNSPATLEKEGLMLLLRQSDNQMFFKRDYPAIAIPSDPLTDPVLFSLLDSAYKRGDFEGLLQLSKELGENGTSFYFRGQSYLALKRIGEAKFAFSQVSSEHHLYPYAKIALAQLKVMKQEMKSAEADIKELLSMPTIAGEIRNRLYLMLGQILFEMGSPQAALAEFNKVPPESAYYNERLLKSAWCLVQTGSVESAVMLLNEANALSLDNPVVREARALIGYSYIKMDKGPQAALHFDELLGSTDALKKRLDSHIGDKDLRERYIKALLNEENPAFTPEEARYLSMLRGDPAIEIILKEHGALMELRQGLLRKRGEYLEKKAHMRNMLKGLEKTSSGIERNIKKIRSVLSAAHRIAERDDKLGPGLGGPNAPFLKSIEKIIYARWEESLKRKINEDEKKIVRLIIYDGGENLECTNSPLVCPILQIMTTGRPKAVKSDDFVAMAKILEVIGHDIAKIGKGEETYFERIYAGLEARMKERVSLAEAVINDSEKIDERLRQGLASAEAGLGRARASLDSQIKSSFTKLKFELEDYKYIVTAGREKVKGFGVNREASPLPKK